MCVGGLRSYISAAASTLSSIYELYIYNGRVLLGFAVTFLKGGLSEFRAEFPRRERSVCSLEVRLSQKR